MNNEPRGESRSTLESTYADLTREHVDEWVETRRIEDLRLDFSTAPECFTSRDERENLAKAISGFANAMGGLIVWGVRATRDSEGVDAAQAVVPIREPVKFLSNLTSYSGSMVSPPVPGLLSRLIDHETAVTLVPESDTGPFMANIGKCYYARSGDASRQMEHYQVVDAFNRRRHADLRIRATRYPNADAVILEVENVGRTSAKAPYLELRPLGNWGSVEDGNLPRVVSRSGVELCFGGSLTTVVHPQTRLFVCHFAWRGHHEKTPATFEIEYALAAEDAPLKTGKLVVRNQPAATERS